MPSTHSALSSSALVLLRNLSVYPKSSLNAHAPASQTGAAELKKKAKLSTNSDLAKLLSVDNQWDPRHTPLVKSLDELAIMNETLRHVQELDALVNAVNSKRNDGYAPHNHSRKSRSAAPRHPRDKKTKQKIRSVAA
ncbi:expressed unknown protein [Seminavis robusta]|uniref:Uncharacterized protein n=1 Tax=Seminavis robusta TaxID=568900 RepID=A0A9N8HJ59_9STRA|nr:expressed unknown protein [Seminavis robusta]|eukprot:Sro742_g195900.1 n/a (137) ;mRNA; r:19056-19466